MCTLPASGRGTNQWDPFRARGLTTGSLESRGRDVREAPRG